MSEDTEWKTIRVPKDVYENAKERKEEHGVTWGQYVNPHAWHSVFDEPQETLSTDVTIDAMIEADKQDVQEIKEQLDRIETAQGGTVSESLDIADGALSELRQEVRKLQELVEQVPEQTAETFGQRYK